MEFKNWALVQSMYALMLLTYTFFFLFLFSLRDENFWLLLVLLSYLPTIIFSQLAIIGKYNIRLMVELDNLRGKSRKTRIIIGAIFGCFPMIPNIKVATNFGHKVHKDYLVAVLSIKVILIGAFLIVFAMTLETVFEFIFYSLMLVFLTFGYLVYFEKLFISFVTLAIIVACIALTFLYLLVLCLAVVGFPCALVLLALWERYHNQREKRIGRDKHQKSPLRDWKEEIRTEWKRKFTAQDQKKTPCCGIGLEDFKKGKEAIELHGDEKHIFHIVGVEHWMRRSRNGPLGRKDLIDIFRIEQEVKDKITLGRNKSKEDRKRNEKEVRNLTRNIIHLNERLVNHEDFKVSV